MSGGGRVVCPRCGANNFDTQAACWKCGASLSTAASASAGPAPVAPPNMGGPTAAPSSASLRSAPGSASPASLPVSPMAAASYRPATMDPAVAIWSAIALGILFPYFAVPAGIVFLMLDDRRKAEVGRVTLVWGIIGSVLNALVTYWMIQGAIAQVRQFVPFLGGGKAAGITLPNQTQPSLTGPAPQDAVRDLKFPSP